MPSAPRPPRPSGALPLSRYPNVYDAAFSWDRSEEARTFLRVATARLGRRPRSAVELACGSGPLARRWALGGLEVYGIDRSAPAIARAKALGRGVVPLDRWRLGELRRFRLPHPVDLAVVPMDGLGYLVEAKDLVGFFRSARRCLAPGGVLAIDLTVHPKGVRPLLIESAWTVSLRPRGQLRVSWRSRGAPWGSPPRRWEVGRITAQVPGRKDQIFWECRPHAILTAPTLRHLAEEAGGFGEMQLYSDAAHRVPGRPLHRVRPGKGTTGARLIVWTAV
jgi:SAM-dependent methyltransferase